MLVGPVRDKKVMYYTYILKSEKNAECIPATQIIYGNVWLSIMMVNLHIQKEINLTP